MIITIENEFLVVKIDSIGAELRSIRKKGDPDGIEYLWQKNPDVWERQAPLLFPVIGRLKDEEYTFEGKSYRMQIHGFARFAEFGSAKSGGGSVVFRTGETVETLKEYPFAFGLSVAYRLEGSKIIKEHNIKNKGEKPMPYEIGGHEGFNLALFEGEEMEDYYIGFPGEERIRTHTTDKDIMLEKETKEVSLDEGRLYLSPEVFKDDALILEGLRKNKVYLGNTMNGRGVVVEFDDFKYLGIWTKYMRANYICIEPWTSLPDGNYLGKELLDKRDIRILPPYGSERLVYTIEIR
ncbi:MAG: aldose 1-epimerase family protein [Clostridia bacterium]|nr:aldose 1-epimerase family protein [Clostridia bacterium]